MPNLFQCIRPSHKENIKPDFLLRLPPQLVMEIFDKFQLDDLLHYMHVHPSQEVLAIAKQRIGQFRELKIRWTNLYYLKPEVLRMLCKNVTNFTYDGFSMRYVDIHCKVLHNFIQRICPTQLQQLSIRSVSLRESTMDILMPVISRVTALDLSYCTINDSVVCHILAMCLFLVEFTMLGNKEFTGTVFRIIIPPRLKRIIVEKGDHWKIGHNIISQTQQLTVMMIEKGRPCYITGNSEGIEICQRRWQEIRDPCREDDPNMPGRHQYLLRQY